MRKLKVGDKVRIRKDLEVGKHYNDYLFNDDIFNDQMAYMRGKVATISAFCDNGKYFRLKEFPCWWTFEMVEEVLPDKLNFNKNVTILFKDGKKYIAKCHPEDTYDREKGLLLCLAKAYGYSYQDIQDMLSNAEIQGDTKKYKITLSEFWANKGKKNMAIHCKTEKEANELMKAFDRAGEVWDGGENYLANSYYGYRVCYDNGNRVGIIETYERLHYRIYEFDEVDLSR